MNVTNKMRIAWFIHQGLILIPMFGLFKKETEKEKLQKQYKQLLKEAHALSQHNRKAADEKLAQAEELAKQLDNMP